MGKMETICDYLSDQLHTPVGVVPTSGYRSSEYNHTIGGSPTSNHIWRDDHGYIRVAGDYRFINKQTKVYIPCSIVFPLLKPFGGEIYWNKPQDIIHIAEQGFNEPHFIKD